MENHIKIGIGVMIFKDGKVLLSKRKGSQGEGEYAFPGGHMEYGESFEECARRAIMEEAGIKIKNIHFLCLGTILWPDMKHYIQIGLMADWEEGQPEILEPDKLEEWIWYEISGLPKPLFFPTQLMVDSYVNKKNYSDIAKQK